MNQRGLSTLELALSLPALFIFILGVYDVTRVFQVQDSLHLVAETTARELSTTAGSGAKSILDDRVAYYQWTLVETVNSPHGGSTVNERSLGDSFSEADVPRQCFSHSATTRCFRIFSHFSGIKGAEGSPDLDQALTEVGIKELQAFLPSAQTGCVGAYCASFKLHVASSGLTVDAVYELPLLVLIGNPITLSASASHPYEGSFTNQLPNVGTCKQIQQPDGTIRPEC